MKLKRMSLKLIISLIFCGLTNWVTAQDCGGNIHCHQINIEMATDTIIPRPVSPFVTTNVGYSYSIGVDNQVGLVNYFEDEDNLLNPASGLALTLPTPMPVDGSDTTNFIILAPNGMVPTPGTYPFEIDLDDGTFVASRTFEVTVEDPRSPVSIVLVLDHSGSMGLTPLSAEVGDPSAPTRMQILRTAGSLLSDKLFEFSAPGDLLAITTFASAPNDPSPGSISNLTSINPEGVVPFTDYINDVTLFPVGGSTLMGPGLIAGKAELPFPSTGENQYIILFTDGEQNGADQVNDAGTHTKDTNTPLNNSDNSIQIYAIGTGAAAAVGGMPVLLSKIANANKPTDSPTRYFLLNETAMDDPLSGIVNFFDEIFQSILSSSSPQTVGVIKGLMPPQNLNSQSFEINQGIDKILFELLTLDQEPFFNIEKNGTSITDSNTDLKFIRRANSILAVVDLSENTAGIVSEGIWKISIGSGTGGGKPYQIKAQVDDHRLDYTFEASADDFKVEDVLKFDANIAYDGSPLEDATISALVFKPGEDLGDLLARAEVKFDPSSGGDVTSVGYQKLLALIADNPAMVDSLQLKENLVLLTHSGGGNYEAQFSDTDVTGAYQIIARISGSNATVGNYERVIRRTAYLRFGDPDVEASSMNYTLTGPNSFQLEYTPMYFVNGEARFVGPGFAGGLNIVGTNINTINTTDNGDGSYTINVTITNANTNPDISVVLSGEEVYEGEASDFDNQGGILDDIKDWVESTFGISFWIFLLILILILLIIWIIKKVIK